MGRQQREKCKKGKASKKNAKAKDEEIPSTPCEVSLNEPSLSADPVVEDNVASVITVPTAIQKSNVSSARMTRRKTRTRKGDVPSKQPIRSGDPSQSSGVESGGSTISPERSARNQDDGVSPSRTTQTITQSSKGEVPSNEPVLSDDLAYNSGVEGDDKANSSVQKTSGIQEDDGSPVRMTRRMTRSCKVTVRINEKSNECDRKASEASSKAAEDLAESLQQELEVTVDVLQEVTPTTEPLMGQGNKASPAAKSGTVTLESRDPSPSSFDLSKLSPHSNAASPVVCLERCSESDRLARQEVQSSFEALSFSPEEEDLLAAQKPMPLRRKIEFVEDLSSREVVNMAVIKHRKNPKIGEHLGKRNGCKRKISPSSTAFKIQSLDEGSCTEGVSGSAADVLRGMDSEPSPSQLGIPALPRARSKRSVGRGEKRSFPGSDNDQVPCRKLLKLDSCELGNKGDMECQSVMNCGNSNDTSDTRLHEQENCCRCADGSDNANEFSGSSRQCNCRVQRSSSYQRENLASQNENILHLEYQPGDSTASVCESTCDRSRTYNKQSLDQCDSDINLSSSEHEEDDPRDLPLKCSVGPGGTKSISDDCNSVNTSKRNDECQEDIYQGDPRYVLTDSSLKCSLVRGDREDIPDDCSSVNISRRNYYSQEHIHPDDRNDSSLKCSLVPGDMEGALDVCSSVNSSKRNDVSQEEHCQNDLEDPGCFGRNNHSMSSVHVYSAPVVQHEECSRLLGGGATSKSNRKRSRSSRRRQDNPENSDSDGSRSRKSSRNLVGECGTDAHQEDQVSDRLQDFSGGNTWKDSEGSRSSSPQNSGQCSRTMPLSKAFSNWKSCRSASSLGEQTDEHFLKYNDSCREKQNTLTDTSSSQFSGLIGSESSSHQGSKVHSSPLKLKNSYSEDCVNGKFPAERGTSCSVSPQNARSYNCIEVEREEYECFSEDLIRTERISVKTDSGGSMLSVNQHTTSETHSSLRFDGNSDDCASDASSHRSTGISLDSSVGSKLQSQVFEYAEKQIVMNSEDCRNEEVSGKLSHNVSKPLKSDLGSKSNIPAAERENCYKNKLSAKSDQSRSKLNSKANSESHSKRHEPELKLSNGFDLALDESSKYVRGEKMNSNTWNEVDKSSLSFDRSSVKKSSSTHERKNKKLVLGDNHRTDSEPVKKEKSHPHSKSSSARKSDDVINNKCIQENVKDRIISKKKKSSRASKSLDQSLSSKDGKKFDACEGKSSFSNEFDKGVPESDKVNDHAERSKVVDSSHSGRTKTEYDMIRKLLGEKRHSNVTKVKVSSEVGGKDEKTNKCKRTGKSDSGINTTNDCVSHNVEEQPTFTDEHAAADDDRQERGDVLDVNTVIAGESQLHNTSSGSQSTDTNSEIDVEDRLKLLLRNLEMKFGNEKLFSILSSLGDSSSTQDAAEGKEPVPCHEEREQFNESTRERSPKELGRTHVRNLNSAFEETDIRLSSVVVPGTKESDQKGESSEEITGNKQQPTNEEVEDTSSSEQRNLSSSESYSNVRNLIQNQEAESQSDMLSNAIKPLKGVGNCYKDMCDNRKMNSSAASLLKIRLKPSAYEPLVNNSLDRSSKQPRDDVKSSSCKVNLAVSQSARIVEGESAGYSSPTEELSPTNPKFQGNPKMRTRGQKIPTRNQANDGYEKVLTALHLGKSPRSRDEDDRTVSGLQVMETPARSSSENSGMKGNKINLSERKEIKKAPEASKVVQKAVSPVRKRLKRNWIVNTTETPPVSETISVMPSTPPTCTTPVPSSCSSLESSPSPSRRNVLSSHVEENSSQNETFPVAQSDICRKSVPSSTLNLYSSEGIMKVPSVLEEKGVSEESPFKIPSPDKLQKNVLASSKTQEASTSRTKPSTPVKTPSRVLNIPKINRCPTSLSSTANPVNKPQHPRITAPPQTNEEDCDDDDAISLFAESTDLDIEDMLNSTLSSSCARRQMTTMGNLNSSHVPRHNFVHRQVIEMPPEESRPELEPEDVQTEMQEMEVEENNQEEEEEEEVEEEEEEEEMEVDNRVVDESEALDGIEDDRESVLAELLSRQSLVSFMDYLICNNSEEVKLCVNSVNIKPFSDPEQDSRISAVTPAQTNRLSPGRATPTTQVSAKTPALPTRLSPGRATPTTQVSAKTPALPTRLSPGRAALPSRASPDTTRPSLGTPLQISRPSPVKSAQATTKSPRRKPRSAKNNTLDISSKLVDYHVPKFLNSQERQRFARMCLKHCYSFLNTQNCFNKKCKFRHVVPKLERNEDVLKVMKWCAERGFHHMANVYSQSFIQYVCDTTDLQGFLLWNGILGCLVHAGITSKDAINSVIKYVFHKDRVEYFAPVLEVLVKHNKLLINKNILLIVCRIQGFEFPSSVVKYLLTEPKTKQDLMDITWKFLNCESLNCCLCRVERPLIQQYSTRLRSAGLADLASKFEQVSVMPMLNFNKSRPIVNGGRGLLPLPNHFRPCAEELFKVPSMSVKESLTQAKSNLRSNLLSRKFSSEKQQLMESSDVRTPVCESYRSANSKNFGGVITSEFDVLSSHKPEAVEHELPLNGLVTRLPPRTLLEDHSSYPRNMTKGHEVHDHSAGSNSSNKVMLLERAGNDKLYHGPALGTPVEQEPRLCSSPFSAAFSGSSSSQPHFSLSSLSQEGPDSPFSPRKMAASESNSSKSMSGRLSPVQLLTDNRSKVEDFGPSRVDFQDRLPVKSRLGVPNSSPVLEESRWNQGSVWGASPLGVERDTRTKLRNRSRDSDSRLPEWKLLNLELEGDFHDLAPSVGPCSPAAVDENLISLRRVLLSAEMLSALNILRKFCMHEMKYDFVREAHMALKSNLQLSSMLFGRLMLQSDREPKSAPLLHVLCSIGVNLMFDLMDLGVVSEAHVIYTLLKDRHMNPASAKVLEQEQMSPCVILLKCCEICMHAKNYHEAKSILLTNQLQYARPEKWKVRGVADDSRYRVDVVHSLLQRLANDGPSITASKFLIAVMQAQPKKFTPIDIRKYSNMVMLNLLHDSRRTEAIDLYMEIETERNCLEAPTYRWLLIILEQENRTVIAHRLYGVACLMSVYPLINWNSRPLHVKVFSYWLQEEILVVIRDFLHQLKQGDQLKPTDDPAHLNLCIYIETQVKPLQLQHKSYPLILSQVNDSIDDVKQRLFGVLRRLRLHATSIPQDRTVQINPESLAEWLKSPAF